MQEEQRFNAYVETYDLTDPQIALKKNHTWRVVEKADQIAHSLPLNDHERRLAHLAALFHDIGRFEQVKRYHTFYDVKSVNHAALGAQILRDQPIFLSDLSKEDQELIIQAVYAHGLLEIPLEHQGLQRTLDQIVRDADKLDIFFVAATEDPAITSGQTLEKTRQALVSSKVYEAIQKGQCVRREDRQSGLDIWISFLGFVFDLKYPISFQIALNEGHWKKPLTNLLNQGLIENPKSQEQVQKILESVQVALEKGAIKEDLNFT